MKYEVSYKCVLSYMYDPFCGLPMLNIRYRPSGKLLWKRFEQPIDLLAHNRSYGGYQSSMTLNRYSKSERIKYFDEVLRSKFDGNMDSYVKEVAYVEIINNRVAKKHEDWMINTMLGWVTNKWNYLEVDIPD